MANEDTVEAFLAREQEQLAGIDDDFGALSTADPPQNGGFNHFNEPVIDLELEDSAVVPNGGVVIDDTFLNGTTQLTAPKEEIETPAVIPNTLSALPLHQQTAMRQAATPTPPPTREEPAKIKTWRQQQRERLEKKDLNEETEKKKLREQAKRELEDWYKNRNEQLEKTMKRNRAAEKELMAQRESDKPGQEWERVAGMVDFNPKSARAAKDLSRFRSILLQMKNQPQKNGK